MINPILILLVLMALVILVFLGRHKLRRIFRRIPPPVLASVLVSAGVLVGLYMKLSPPRTAHGSILRKTCVLADNCPLDCIEKDWTDTYLNAKELESLVEYALQTPTFSLSSIPQAVAHLQLVNELCLSGGVSSSLPELSEKSREVSTLLTSMYLRSLPRQSLREAIERNQIDVGTISDPKIDSIVRTLLFSESIQLSIGQGGFDPSKTDLSLFTQEFLAESRGVPQYFFSSVAASLAQLSPLFVLHPSGQEGWRSLGTVEAAKILEKAETILVNGFRDYQQHANIGGVPEDTLFVLIPDAQDVSVGWLCDNLNPKRAAYLTYLNNYMEIACWKTRLGDKPSMSLPMSISALVDSVEVRVSRQDSRIRATAQVESLRMTLYELFVLLSRAGHPVGEQDLLDAKRSLLRSILSDGVDPYRRHQLLTYLRKGSLHIRGSVSDAELSEEIEKIQLELKR